MRIWSGIGVFSLGILLMLVAPCIGDGMHWYYVSLLGFLYRDTGLVYTLVISLGFELMGLLICVASAAYIYKLPAAEGKAPLSPPPHEPDTL